MRPSKFTVCVVVMTMIASMGFASSAISGDLQFTNAPIPTNDLDKRSILTSQFAVVDGETVPVAYHTIMRSGDQPGSSPLPFGTLIDIEGTVVVAEDGSPRVSNDNDFSSLIKGDDGKLYMVSHFESRPAAMYLTQLKQTKDGNLVAKKTGPWISPM